MEQGIAARGAASAAWWCDGAAHRVQLLYGGVAIKIHPRADESSDCSDAEQLDDASAEETAAAAACNGDEGEGEDDSEYEDGDDDENNDEGEEGVRPRCRGYAPDEIAILLKPRWPARPRAG